MKILFYYWNQLMADDVIYAMARLGFDMVPAVIPMKPGMAEDEEFTGKLLRAISAAPYDAVFSVHYFSLVAYCCHERGIPYISWEYDSPVSIINAEYFNYDTNFCFMFDRMNVEQCRRSGYSRVYHMPLAVNAEKYDRIILNDEDMRKYVSEISFVGQLYPEKFIDAVQLLPDFYRAYLTALCDAQLNIYGTDVITDSITAEIMKAVNGSSEFMDSGCIKFYEDTGSGKDIPADILAFYLQKYVTRRERLLLLGLLSRHFEVKLYSPHTHEILEKVEQCGYADYIDVMPKVFKASKINLNITLRTIQSGIPLRCFDIMGCGGFLLTNYQSEISEYFADGRELVIYESIEDAYEKTGYYLKHDDERQQIAQNGCRAVRERFSFDSQLKKMFEIAGLLKTGGNV